MPELEATFMNKEREKLYDKLDNLRDDYRVWAEFPCNKRGNSKSVDAEHAKFEREISDLQKKVANLSAWLSIKICHTDCTMKKQGYVMVDGNKISVNNVKFLDIEEDRYGVDLMTFELDGEVHKSYIYGE